MNFKVIVKDKDDTLHWELPYKKFQITEELNNDRSATFSFDLATIQPIADNYNIRVENIFSATYREIYVYDEDDNIIYGGYIDELQFSAGRGSEGVVSITSKGFFSLLEARYTDNLVEYTAEDSSDIAWDLINTSQLLTNGNFGITRGANPVTKDRDRTYRFKQVAEAIRKLSANEVKEGFDFEIDNSKVFNVYYPEKGTRRENIIFDRAFNISTYNVIKAFMGSMGNQVYVIGEGQGDDTVYVQRDAETVYKENFFLLQRLLSEKDVQETDTLNDKGDAYLDANKYPRYIVSQITTDFSNPLMTEYNIGDRVRVKIADWNIDRYFRVVKRILNDDSVVTLSFSEI